MLCRLALLGLTYWLTAFPSPWPSPRKRGEGIGERWARPIMTPSRQSFMQSSIIARVLKIGEGEQARVNRPVESHLADHHHRAVTGLGDRLHGPARRDHAPAKRAHVAARHRVDELTALVVVLLLERQEGGGRGEK